ncbi:hypothetical protein [Actinomycetospora straminea]|uniref:AAA ATPase-like protein n=1 Tax=Actinomycetospora straminea TaxID=663607 RepID=A0ABP9EGS1_9PSEU|nr:hypothetical protein [Actinomycetospora straminea]MDD7933718.1 hypothetical protein [Actinomycetospora straminea]
MDQARPVQLGNKVVGSRVSFNLDGFRDRKSYREEIGRVLASHQARLLTLVGRRGIGKSALAARVLAGLEKDVWPHTDERLPVAGLAYISVRRDGFSLETIYFNCTRLFTADTAARLRTYWSHLPGTIEKLQRLFDEMAGAVYIVLLDNLEDVLTDEGRPASTDLSEFLDALFRSDAHPRVLVTSRIPLRLESGLQRNNLIMSLDDGLPTDEAVEFMRELDPNATLGIRDASEQKLAAAAEKLHGVPRAMELVVGALEHDYLTLPSFDELVNNFAERPDIVAGLVHDQHETLNDDETLVLMTLSARRRPTSTETVEWTLKPFAPHLDVPPVLSALARRHLVSFDRRERVWELHPLDSDLLDARLRGDPELHNKVHRRIAEWHSARQVKPSEWTSPEDLNAHRREFDHRIRAGDLSEGTSILARVWQFLVWHGSVRSVSQMVDDLGPIAARERVVLPAAAFVRLIEGPESECIALLEPLRAELEVEESREAAQALMALGDVYRRMYRLAEAAVVLRVAATKFGRLGDVRWRFHTLLVLGLAHASGGEVAEAGDISETIGSELELNNDESLGRLHDLREMVAIAGEQWAEAYEHGASAAAHYERAGVLEALGYVYNGMGLARLGEGAFDDAIYWFTRGSQEGGIAIGDSRIEGLCLLNLACAHLSERDYDAAAVAAGSARRAFAVYGSEEAELAELALNASIAGSSGDDRAVRQHVQTLVRSRPPNVDLYPAQVLETNCLAK